MKINLTTLLFLIASNYCVAQYGDCLNSKVLNIDSSFSIENVSGYGEILEIKGNKLGSLHYFTEEHNTIWYTFKATNSGKLTFDITPIPLDNDWDFLLFEGDIDACEEIVNMTRKPIRTNLARNNPKLNDVTGLSRSADANFIPAGKNSNHSAAVNVKSGDSFVLVVDNNKVGGNGHKIEFDFIPEQKPEQTQPIEEEFAEPEETSDWDNETSEGPKSTYQINLVEQGSKNPISGDVKIILEIGFGNDSIIEFKNTKQVVVEIENNKNFSVNVRKEGYMFYSSNHRSLSVDTNITLTCQLPKAEIGQIVSLPDINFKQNTTHLLTSSINALQEIFEFLQKNPNAVVEIRGHVNAPGYENSGKVKRFSEKRAEEVKEFLVGMGIEHNRIKTVGLGNEEMLYPSPQTYEQEKANRRVEVKILEN